MAKIKKKTKRPIQKMFDPGPPPERLDRIRRNYYVEDGDTLQNVIDHVPQDMWSQATFEGFYDDMELVWWGPESDDHYEIRLESHRKAQIAYQKWYDENHEELEQAERDRLEAELKRLESQKETFEKSLETTRKKLEELRRKGKKLL